MSSTKLELTDEQRNAVHANARRLTIRAGAGAGKTAVLTSRYLKHVKEDGADPDRILAITYTRRAAAEMRARIVEQLREAGLTSQAQRALVGPISTIHGFCERLLREYPFEIGIDPRFDVLDETAAGELLSKCIRTAVDRGRTADESIQKVIEAFGGVAAYRTEEVSGSLLDMAKEVLTSLRGSGPGLERLRAMAESPDATLHEWSLFLDESGNRLLGEEYSPEWRNDADLAKRITRKMPWLKDTPNADDALLTCGLAKLILAAHDVLMEEFEARRCMDFAELEQRACLLLESRPDVLTSRYDWVLVDEAQDMNPLQHRIVNAIESRSTLLVGDAQQSIFLFRGARRDLFVECVEKHERKDLRTNYRSTKSILEAVERVFGNRWRNELLRMRVHDEENVGVPVELWQMPIDGDDALVSGCTAMMESTKCLAGNVAVLVRTGNVDGIVAEFAAQNIKTVVHGRGRHYFMRMEIRDLASALLALADPHDNLAMLSVLRSSLVGVSLDAVLLLGNHCRENSNSAFSALSAFSFEDADARRVRSFLEWFVPLSNRLHALTAWEALAEVFAATRIDARLALMPDGPRLIANSRKLLSLAIRMKEMTPKEFGEWADRMRRIRSFAADAESLGRDADAVHICTVHGAKGLEWDNVIVNARPSRIVRRKDLAIDTESGVFALESKQNPAYSAMRRLNEVAELEEEVRLLYVAMTRAKKRLCVAFSSASDADRGQMPSRLRNYWGQIVCTALLQGGKATDGVELRDFTNGEVRFPRTQ
jgi:ATP-dependent exoDNAse (exonuclease V) beta subunit